LPHGWRCSSLGILAVGPEISLERGTCRCGVARRHCGHVSAADGSVWGRDADVALLFENHRQSIFSYCRGRLESDEDAEDALQTTFVHALRSFRRGVRPRTEAAWLYAIARNVCRERWRSSHRRGAPPRARDVDELADVLAAREPEDDELFDLDSALERLAERQREALLLREWRGLSYVEIAQRLDMSEAAVETLLYRARRALAQELEQGRHGTHGLWAPLGVLVGLPRRLWPAGATAKLAVGTAAVSVAVVAGGVVPRIAHHDRTPIRHAVPRAITTHVAVRLVQTRATKRAVPARRRIVARSPHRVVRAARVTPPPLPQPVVSASGPAASRPAPPPAPAPAPAPAESPAPTAVPESAAPPASRAPPPAAPAAAEPATSTVAQPLGPLPALPTTPVTDALAPVVQTVTQLPVAPQLPQSVDLGSVQVQTNLPPLPSLPALP